MQTLFFHRLRSSGPFAFPSVKLKRSRSNWCTLISAREPALDTFALTKLRSETRTPETVHFVIALIHVHRSNMARKTNNMLSTDRWDVILTWLHSKGDAKESPFFDVRVPGQT